MMSKKSIASSTCHKLLISYLTLISTLLFFGCDGNVKSANKSNAPARSLMLHVGNKNYVGVNTKESVLNWKGSSLNGLNAQTGYVYLSKGELMIENGQLTGATIEIDMSTIEDKKHGRDNKLVDHLKDADFFEVERFPFSTIVITKVASINNEDKTVTGNLTIKGITHPVTFPVKLKINDENIKVNGRLVIDRTKWNVRYKSAKFYNNLANQTMSDEIEFDISIVARK